MNGQEEKMGYKCQGPRQPHINNRDTNKSPLTFPEANPRMISDDHKKPVVWCAVPEVPFYFLTISSSFSASDRKISDSTSITFF